jgi:sterol desaturase/sphingolipid hydroxylase (fatty acid hydroxylase superfamily)
MLRSALKLAAQHWATMFTDSKDWEIASFFLLVLVFEIWERLRPAHQIDKLADLRMDVLSFAFAVLVNRLSRGGVNAIVTAVSPGFVLHSLEYLRALPGAAKILFALIFVDFTIYWIHRAQHRFNTMWRTHKWHHSIEHMYWFAGFRTSFLHSFIYNIPQAVIPMQIFDLSPLQAGIGYSLGLFIQFWEHTNVKVDIGVLKWVFITPAFHRVHHSATRHKGMNLGTTFSIWDRMFGTYVDPETMPESYPLGLGEPIEKREVPRMLIGL